MTTNIGASKDEISPFRRSGRLMGMKKATNTSKGTSLDERANVQQRSETPVLVPVTYSEELGSVNTTGVQRATLVPRDGLRKKKDVVETEVEVSKVRRSRKAAVVGKSKKGKEKAVKRRDQRNPDRIRIRSPPCSLYFLLKVINTQKKKAVAGLGFESVLGFNISEIPTKLGMLAVKSFDASSCEMRVGSVVVKVTRELVAEYLGVPTGGVTVSAMLSTNIKDSFTQEFKSQFPPKKRVSQVNLYNHMLSDDDAGRMFKVNFLVLFMTVMAEGNKCDTVNQKFLPCINDLENVKALDWAGYILDSLKKTTKSWDPKTHFNGPLVFLTVLYAQLIKPKELDVNNKVATMNLWSAGELFELEEEVIKKTGTGYSMVNVMHSMGEASTPNKKTKKCNKRKRVAQDDNELSENQVSGGNDKMNFEETKKLLSSVFENVRKAVGNMDEIVGSLEEDGMEDQNTQGLRCMMDRLKDAVESADGVLKDSVTASETKHLEEVRRRKETEDKGKKVLEEDVIVSLGSPNFDLQITQQMQQASEESFLQGRKLSFGEASVQRTKGDSDVPCNETEMGETEGEANAVGVVGDELVVDSEKSEEETEPLGRGQRFKRAPPFLRSPYHKREVILSNKFESVEKKIAETVFAAIESPRKIIFNSRGLNVERVAFESLCPDFEVDENVVNAWCAVLNHQEINRSKMTVTRLFCKANMVSNHMLDNEAEYQNYSENFGRELAATVRYSEYKILHNVELVLFPIQHERGWYAVSVNLNESTVHIIDNRVKRDVLPGMVYGELPILLVRMLCDYMSSINHKGALLMANESSGGVVAMPWQTENNMVDSGVFLMRHLETYKGKFVPFETGLDVDASKQKEQLNSLRVKILTKILTSGVNTCKLMVEKEVYEFIRKKKEERQELKKLAVGRIMERRAGRNKII